MDDQLGNEFDAGYADDTTVPTTTPEPVKEAEPAQKFAQITEEQYKELLAKTTAIDEIKAENKRQFDKVFGSLGGVTQVLANLQEASKRIADKPSNEQIKEAMKSPEKWAALKQDYAEWADATEELVDSRIAGIKQISPDQISEIVNQRLQGQSAEMEQKIVHSVLNAVSPGWTKEVESPAFKEWQSKQPPEIQALANSDDVGDAARMLRLYEKSKEAASAPNPAVQKAAVAREKRISAAVMPRGTGGVHPGPSASDDFEVGYNS